MSSFFPKGLIPSGLPSNVKVLPWIPQNDLLAHGGTKAFISHTGHNSLNEAAFYGVPLICMPLFLDQFSNCAQAQSVGMAIGVDIKTVTGDEIYNSITRIIQEPRYLNYNSYNIIVKNFNIPCVSAARLSKTD